MQEGEQGERHKSCSSFLGKPRQEEVTLNGGGETNKLTKHVIVTIISCNCSNRADLYSLFCELKRILKE